MRIRHPILGPVLGLAMLLSACKPQAGQAPPDSTPSPRASIRDLLAPPPPAPRWYTAAQVAQGSRVFGRHCQVCHRERATGDPDWRKPRPDGGYPPPPLDGSAHAWHHPLPDLLKAINEGFQTEAGSLRMPAFARLLSESDKHAVIAYIQSLWPDPTYDVWYAQVSGGKPAFKAQAP